MVCFKTCRNIYFYNEYGHPLIEFENWILIIFVHLRIYENKIFLEKTRLKKNAIELITQRGFIRINTSNLWKNCVENLFTFWIEKKPKIDLENKNNGLL